MNLPPIIVLTLISTLNFSQDNSQDKVFTKMIAYEIEKGTSELYIRCDRPKTVFDRTDFKEQTELNAPEEILNEIETNATKSTDGKWDSKLLEDLKYSHVVKGKTCLTRKDVELISRNNNARQNILTISEPLFDASYENCVVSVSYWKSNGSAYGHSYFLKKVYGIWTVVIAFDHWMT